MIIRVGTRASKLALAQTQEVISLLSQKNPKISFEVVPIRTTGDKIAQKRTTLLPFPGIFIKELEESLLSAKIDVAIHSFKDVPIEIHPELEIVAVCPRENPCDAIVYKKDVNLSKEAKIRIGTSSLRREFQLKNYFREAEVISLRGNIDTRLKKVREDKTIDAIVVAYAGLKRLNYFRDTLAQDNLCCYPLPLDIVLPAAGQGSLAIETRKSINAELKELLKSINCERSFLETMTERTILKKLGGGCHRPIGILARINGDTIDIWLRIKNDHGGLLEIREKCKFNWGDKEFHFLDDILRRLEAFKW